MATVPRRRKATHALLVAALIGVSGCGTSEFIDIDAPVETVWAYLGDSRNAQAWSVYFDHITPLPGEPDGQPGSIRRCFRRADETGIRWDERVVRLETYRLREIHTYAIHGYKNDLFNQAEYRVLQRFEPLPGGRTRLSFTTTLLKPRTFVAISTFVSDRAEAERIIRLNLRNIAKGAEAMYRRLAYVRPHPYEPLHFWD